MGALRQFLQGRREPAEANPSPAPWVGVSFDPVYVVRPASPFPPGVERIWPAVARFRAVFRENRRGDQQAVEALLFDVIEVVGADDPALPALRRQLRVGKGHGAWRLLGKSGWFARNPLLGRALAALARRHYFSVVRTFLVDLSMALQSAGQDPEQIAGRFTRHLCEAPNPEVTEEILKGMASCAVQTAQADEREAGERAFNVSQAERSARGWAAALARKIERRAGQPLAASYFSAMMDTRGVHKERGSPTDFGELLAHAAHGAGLGWEDFHPPLPFGVPLFYFDEYGTASGWRERAQEDDEDA